MINMRFDEFEQYNLIENKLTNIINRTHPNIKSGNIIINTKDRDWLISTIKNLLEEVKI